jgi:catechol 2,3-dioxygenase-like lactoylglutathione lyase family enzyme
MIRIHLTSVHVNDQAKALDFYTRALGFEKKHDVPVGDNRWLTVVSPDDPEGTELFLEPDDHPAARAYMEALVESGIPAAQFQVDDIHRQYKRLSEAGVTFTQEPLDMGTVWTAVLDDTCGNLIQLVSPATE